MAKGILLYHRTIKKSVSILLLFLGIYSVSIVYAFLFYGALPIYIPRSSSIESQILNQIKKQSKWIFYLHSISLKVKVRTKFNFDKSYNEAAAQDYDKKRIGELAEKIKKVGYCNLGGEYGSWTVDVSNYTWFGLPWGGLYFTCNGIRTKLPGFHNTI